MSSLRLEGGQLEASRAAMDQAITTFSQADKVGDDLADLTGHDGLAGKVRDFADNWDRKRGQLQKGLEGVRDTLQAIADTFADLDRSMARSLTDGMAQAPVGPTPGPGGSIGPTPGPGGVIGPTTGGQIGPTPGTGSDGQGVPVGVVPSSPAAEPPGGVGVGGPDPVTPPVVGGPPPIVPVPPGATNDVPVGEPAPEVPPVVGGPPASPTPGTPDDLTLGTLPDRVVGEYEICPTPRDSDDVVGTPVPVSPTPETPTPGTPDDLTLGTLPDRVVGEYEICPTPRDSGDVIVGSPLPATPVGTDLPVSPPDNLHTLPARVDGIAGLPRFEALPLPIDRDSLIPASDENGTAR